MEADDETLGVYCGTPFRGASVACKRSLGKNCASAHQVRPDFHSDLSEGGLHGPSDYVKKNASTFLTCRVRE
jgi:hypothetical protein